MSKLDNINHLNKYIQHTSFESYNVNGRILFDNIPIYDGLWIYSTYTEEDLELLKLNEDINSRYNIKIEPYREYYYDTDKTLIKFESKDKNKTNNLISTQAKFYDGMALINPSDIDKKQFLEDEILKEKFNIDYCKILDLYEFIIFYNKNKINNKKGDNNMSNKFKDMFKGFETVECAIGMDMGVYFKRSNGDYVRYDYKSKKIKNTHQVKRDIPAFKIPCNNIELGDVIISGSDLIHITNVNRMEGINLNNGTKQNIVLEDSIMGLSNIFKVQTINPFECDNPMIMGMLSDSESDFSDIMAMSSMMSAKKNTEVMAKMADVLDKISQRMDKFENK